MNTALRHWLKYDLQNDLDALSASRLPVFICGKPGALKQEAATFICRAGEHKQPPEIVDCAVDDDAAIRAVGERFASDAKPGAVFLKRLELLSRRGQGRLCSILSDQLDRSDLRRIFAATSGTAEQEIRERRLSSELYERLATHKVSLAPLRARRDNLESLLEYFLDRHGSVLRFDSQTMDLFKAHEWRGDVVELEQVVCRAIETATRARRTSIERDDLGLGMASGKRSRISNIGTGSGGAASGLSADDIEEGRHLNQYLPLKAIAAMFTSRGKKCSASTLSRLLRKTT